MAPVGLRPEGYTESVTKRLLAALLCAALSVGGLGPSVPSAVAQVVETGFRPGTGGILPLPGVPMGPSAGGLGLGIPGSGVTLETSLHPVVSVTPAPSVPAAPASPAGVFAAPALVRVAGFARGQERADLSAPSQRTDGTSSAGPKRIAGDNGRAPEEFVEEGSGRFDGARPRAESAPGVPAFSATQPPSSPFRLRAVSFARDPLPEVLPLPPGTLDLAAYRAPLRITAVRSLLLTGHAVGLAAAVALLAVGLGWAPLAAGALVGWRQVHREPKGDGMGAFSGMLRARERKQLEGYGRMIVSSLVGRLGLGAERTPSLAVSNDYGTSNATSEGHDIDSSARLTMGEDYASRRFQATASVLAHELGHLFFNDDGGGRLFPNMRDPRSLRLGMAFLTASVRAGLIVKLVLAACLSPALLLHPLGIGFAPILHLIFWVGLAFPVAWAAFLAGIAVSRQNEFRADHFSAWLTDPSWFMDNLQEDIRVDAGHARAPKRFFVRWMDRLLSTHPPHDVRVRRLESLRGRRKD